MLTLLDLYHWLRVPERIQFRLCVLAYRCMHGTAPAYLADSLQLTADAPARRRLRSTDTMTLQVPSTRRSTIGVSSGISSSLEQSTTCDESRQLTAAV